MSSDIIGLIGILVLVLLLFSRMWVGGTMTFVGIFGFMCIEGVDSAMGVLSTLPYTTIADYTLTVLPLFILMGNIVSETGIGEDLYKTGHKWMGSLPGGLAMGTVSACGGFAAICGTSMATALTIGKIALPEMEKFGYNQKLATGCVASGASLGVLIPPSMAFILYAILTEGSVGLLFIAGIGPGVLLALAFMITIYIMSRIKPDMGPAGPKTSFRGKIISLKYTWTMLALFLLVIGGMYLGAFTPNEAGAIGAFGAILITTISRRLSLKSLGRSLLDAGELTAMIVVLLVGAMLFSRFLAVSKLPFTVSDFVFNLGLPRHLIFAAIVIFYLLCGMFLDVISSVILTIPIIYPMILSLGFDSIWFGVVVVLLMEIGLITPPFGMNVFLLSGVSKVPLGTIFRGVIPFVITMLAVIVILSFFPQLALFLPNMMK